MRIRLSDEIRQVIQLYQQYFPPTSDDDAAAASVDEAQALSAALALDKKDITQDNFIEKVKGIFYEYTELSKIQYLRDHDQLLTGKTYRDATFLQRILNTCSEYQRAQENKQWVAEGTLMTYHGYFITSLIVWACKQIDSIKDTENRKWLYARFLEFLTQLLNKKFIKSAASHDSALANAVHIIIEMLEQKISDEEDFIKSNQLREALNRIDLQNLCANFDRFLLQVILDRPVPVNLLADLKGRHTAHQNILDMTYAQFTKLLGQKKIGAASEGTRLMAESEALFNFIKEDFLKPYCMKEYIESFHKKDSQEKSSALGEIRSLLKQEDADKDIESVPEEDFPTYPALMSVDSNIDRTIQKTIRNIFAIRNNLYALSYYHHIAKGINDEAGNLAKIFARGELIAWNNSIKQSLMKLINRLIELQRHLSAKFANQQSALDAQHRQWVSNYMAAHSLSLALIREIKSHIDDINTIEQSMSVNQIREDLDRFEQLMSKMNEGMREVFGLDVENPYLQHGFFEQLRQRLQLYSVIQEKDEEISLLQAEKHEAKLRADALDGKVDDSHPELVRLQEENKRYRREETSRKLRALIMRGLPEELTAEGFSSAEVEQTRSILNEFYQSARGRGKDGLEPDHMREFITESKDYMVRGMRMIKRLDFYIDAYMKSNQSNFTLRLGHFHGQTGRNRAMRLKQEWSRVMKPALYRQLLERMYYGYKKHLNGNRQLGIRGGFEQHVGSVSSEFTQLYARLLGGNRSRHSLRSYLLAYHKELAQYIESNARSVEQKVNSYSFGSVDFYHQHIEKWDDRERHFEIESLDQACQRVAGSQPA